MLSGIESTPTPKDSKLVPEDFDLALRRMKTDLALLDLRRALLHDDLDAPSVLAVADRILELQRAEKDGIRDRSPAGLSYYIQWPF